MSETFQRSTEKAPGARSGFRWEIEATTERGFDESVVRAIRDAFHAVGVSQANRMRLPHLAVQFDMIADGVVRLGSRLRSAGRLDLHLEPLAVPSGRLAYAHLSAWPALQDEFALRGVLADGPSLEGNGAAPRSTSRNRARPSLLHWRLLFDPSEVGPGAPEGPDERPPTAIEIGRSAPGGVRMAGIDYLASQGPTVHAWSAVMADPTQACEAGGRAPFSIAPGQLRPLPDSFPAALRAALLDAAIDIVGRQAAPQLVADLHADAGDVRGGRPSWGEGCRHA